MRLRSDFEVLLLQFGVEFEDPVASAQCEAAEIQLKKRFGAVETEVILAAAAPRLSSQAAQQLRATCSAHDSTTPNVEEQLRTSFIVGVALSQAARRNLEGPFGITAMTFQSKLIEFFVQPDILKIHLFFKPISRGPPLWRFCAPLEGYYEPSQASDGEEVGEEIAAEGAVSFPGIDLDNVIENVTHDSPPASPHPSDARVGDELWASNVERRVNEDNNAISGRLAHELATTDLDMGTFREAEAMGSVSSSVSDERPNVETASSVHEPETIWLLHFKRNPEIFRQCLEDHVSLKSCRDALAEAGHEWNLPSGAKIFVQPWQYQQTIDALEQGEWPVHKLRPYHVVAAENLLPIVEESLSGVPCRQGARVKKRSAIGIAQPPKRMKSNAEVSLDNSNFVVLPEGLDCERTFICMTHTLCNADSVTQSTTEVHAGRNPRRQFAAMCLPDE
jgi:hypothetical protein